MRKCLALLLVFLFMFGTPGINVVAEDTPGYKVWVAPNSVKVLQDQQPPTDPDMELKFKSARNEYESGQIIVSALSSVTTITAVSVSDLVCTDQSGTVIGNIPSNAVSTYVQHYINANTTRSAYPTGWYPDALIPLDKYFAINTNISVAAGMNQGLWFDVKVPENVPAGIYAGSVSITIDGTAQTVPVEFEVWDFTLSNTTHTQTAFDIWLDQFKYLDTMYDYQDTSKTDAQLASAKTEAYRMKEKYAEFFEKYRLTCQTLPFADDDAAQFAQNAATYLNAHPNMYSYRIPFNNRTSENLNHSKEIIQALNNASILDKGYVYWSDEPTTPVGLAKLDTLCTDLDNIKTELGISKIRNLVTMPFNNNYNDKVNLWCPISYNFTSSGFVDAIEPRIARGDEVWFYTCNNPVYPHPSYHINDNLSGGRILSWMKKAYSIQGTLYWAANIFGGSFSNNDGATTASRDIWNNPYADNTAGDGFLVYPGNAYNTEDPFPTIRLESIREGNEDYEYLWMLEQKIVTAAANLGVSVTPDQILKPLYERLFTNEDSYSSDPAVLQGVRREAAQMIMDIDKNPSALIVFGDMNYENNIRSMKVYTEQGSTVKVNGVDVTASTSTGSSLEFSTNLGFTVNTLVDVSVEVTNGTNTRTMIRSFIANPLPPRTPMELYNTEDESQLSKWSSRVNAADIPPTATHSNDWATSGSKSLKLLFSGQCKNAWPTIDMDAKKDALVYKNWKDFETVEFDIKNGSSNTLQPTFCIWDTTESKRYDYKVTLLGDGVAHVSIPISLIYDALGTYNIGIVRFFLQQSTLGGIDTPIYIDNLCLTAHGNNGAVVNNVKKSKIIIDGNVNDPAWTLDKKLEKQIYNTSDNDAGFDVLWNSSFLYAAFDIKDNYVAEPGEKNCWDEDAVELFVDTDLTQGAFDKTSKNVAQFIFTYNNDENVYIGGYIPDSTYGVKASGILQKSRRTADGYSIEIAIPWSVFGDDIVDSVISGKNIGVTAQVDDKDVDGNVQIVHSTIGYTTNDPQNSRNSVNWPVFALSGQPASNADVAAPQWQQGAGMSVSYLNENSIQLSWPEPIDNVGISGYTLVFSTEQLEVGTKYTFSLVVKDSALNQSSALTGLTKLPKPDEDGPDIDVQGIANGGIYYGSSVTPVVTAQDPESGISSLTVTVDGQPWSQGTAITGEGSHTLVATAVNNDSLIKLITTVTVNFILDIQPTIIGTPNRPVMDSNMTAIKYDGSNWVNTDTSNTNWDWYSYYSSAKKWANAKTADGSMFVWIPRFTYKINGTNNISIRFSDGTTDDTSDGYIVHPAFKLGTQSDDKQLDGFWMAKFEASNDGTGKVQSKAGTASWRSISISDAFDKASSTAADIGLSTSSGTHLVKTSEWSAVAYIAQALGSTPVVNTNTSYLTGGNSVTSTVYGINGNQSTTGNVYGVYDMSGGAWEYVAAYRSGATSTNGTNLINANEKYKDAPLKTTFGSNVTGLAIEETSTASTGNTSWDSDASAYVTISSPFMCRGGSYGGNTTSGMYAYYCFNGAAKANAGFRAVISAN